nr:MAG TPA_asm: hypothetical protein [Caudoviricetes sp.]
MLVTIRPCNRNNILRYVEPKRIARSLARRKKNIQNIKTY